MDFADKQTKMKKDTFSFSVCWLSKVILLTAREEVVKNSRRP